VSDGTRLVLAAGARAAVSGMLGVVLGLYLARVGLSPGEVGLVVSAGLAGLAWGV
jgi:hypothetical protein